MKIFLLLNQAYPHGYALTKRFHLFARGFIVNGNSAKIIIPFPTEINKNSMNYRSNGYFDSVPFEYSWKSTFRSKSFFKRRYHDFIGFLIAGLKCLKERPDVVIISTFSFWFYLYLKTISIFFQFKLIREKNEVDKMNKDYLSSIEKLRIKLSYVVFDGLIVISEQLSNYIVDTLNIHKKNIIVPVLVENFKWKEELPVQKTIVYTGTYIERKDGIITILKAFAELINKFQEYKLVLTGWPQKSKDYDEIKRIIAVKGLGENIDFTGYLAETDLRKVLATAKMLILAKPVNRQNLYNFPTKIGEYLISGRPVIATKVGVIGEILEHNKNIIFSDYGIDAIQNKMEFIINNSDLSNKIGIAGKEYALKNFNYLIHTQKMIDFFKFLMNEDSDS